MTTQADGEQPIRILVVEDNEINQEVIQSILETRGFEVGLANDGLEALDALQQGEYDAVFMDIQMPKMDGFEATRRIRQNPAWQALPIIAMTAGAMNYERDILANGMNDSIAKPFDTGELLETLGRWVEPPAPCPPGEQEAPPSHLAEDHTPCIDPLLGLQRHGSDRPAYQRAVDLFRANQAYAIESIRLALEAGEIPTACNLLHRLHHLAAQIGAIPLAKIAAQGEAALQKEDRRHLEQLLIQADLQLHKIMALLSDE